MNRIRTWLKRILPPWLLAIRRNCGGRNRETSLFAANLLKPDLSESMYQRIASALIFSNGVRKSTHTGRNAPILQALFERKEIGFPGIIRVLDIGASLGTDAISNLEVISRYVGVESYTMSDLYTNLLYDPDRKIIFDQDGNLLQVLGRRHFTSLNFEYKYRIEHLYHLFNRLYTARLKKRYQEVKPETGRIIHIPLVYPSLLSNPRFRTARMDVFQPIGERYDLIICMNLLQTRYFSHIMIEAGIKNLKNALFPGGFLLTGVTDQYRLIRAGNVNQME